MTHPAESDAPRPGEFCESHWSWKCQAGQGECPTSPGGTASRWCAVHDEPAAECWSDECLIPPEVP